MTDHLVNQADAVHAIEGAAATPHPRLIFTREQERLLKTVLAEDQLAAEFLAALRRDCDAILEEPCYRRDEQVGRRLLHVSRGVLNRVLRLAMVYRLTGNAIYLDRAEQEMLAAASFPDWNPSHYLDVAEMAMALSLGYDWLYDHLSPSTRASIEQALIDKAFGTYSPCLSINNWNDVCNGGLILTALALADRKPDLASEALLGGVQALPKSLSHYSDEGCHPEGPMYWSYATLFSTALIAGLETACGTDLRLKQHFPGYMQSPFYYLHTIAPSGLFYNYSDAGMHPPAVSSQNFWFAKTLNSVELAAAERARSQRAVRQGALSCRLAPLSLAWWPTDTPAETPDLPTVYHGAGISPVSIHRSSRQDSQASFFGIKAGSPQNPHAHMDMGSFVYESQDVRWAIDLGNQDYHSLEKLGLSIWDNSQEGERWDIFRLNQMSHNIITVNDRRLNVSGRAHFLRQDESSSKLDLTELYSPSLTSYHRESTFQEDSLKISDDITAGQEAASIRWAMLTQAQVSLDGTAAFLHQNGKSLCLSLDAPPGISFEVFETNPPPHDYDTDNPNTRMIGFRLDLAAGQATTLSVNLRNGEDRDD